MRPVGTSEGQTMATKTTKRKKNSVGKPRKAGESDRKATAKTETAKPMTRGEIEQDKIANPAKYLPEYRDNTLAAFTASLIIGDKEVGDEGRAIGVALENAKKWALLALRANPARFFDWPGRLPKRGAKARIAYLEDMTLRLCLAYAVMRSTDWVDTNEMTNEAWHCGYRWAKACLDAGKVSALTFSGDSDAPGSAA